MFTRTRRIIRKACRGATAERPYGKCRGRRLSQDAGDESTDFNDFRCRCQKTEIRRQRRYAKSRTPTNHTNSDAPKKRGRPRKAKETLNPSPQSALNSPPSETSCHDTNSSSSSQQSFPTSFRMFLLARHEQGKGRIDLSYRTLKELISFVKEQGVINVQTYHRFFIHYNEGMERNFVGEETGGPGNQTSFNMKLQLFGLIDHRLLTHILCLIKPKKYYCSLPHPITYIPEVNEYLKNLYTLTYTQYAQKYKEFNARHQRFWMPKDIEELDEDIKIHAVGCENQVLHLTDRNGRFLRPRNDVQYCENLVSRG